VSRTIPEIAADANTLFDALTADLNINLDLPAVLLPTDFDLPPETGGAYEELPALTVAELTTAAVDGTGVFDVLMRSVNSQLAEQFKAQRITGGDYAKVYASSVGSVLQISTQFLMGKDQARLANLQLQETIKLTQAQRVRALADIIIARGQIQQLAFGTAKMELEAHTAENQYALSKMALVDGYNQSLITEANVQLTGEQVEVQRAQTRDTHLDGTPIAGLLGKQKALVDAQVLTQHEELDTARASTKETLLDGSPVGGLVALEKSIKEATMVHMEQQGLLVKEQVEATHAQTADLMTDGVTPIAGLLALEKEMKLSQQKLIEEQYEGARAQVRDTLSTGVPVAGMMGIDKLIKLAQKLLTEEQVDSARATTKDTLQAGGPITGIAAAEKALKTAQKTYVLEQYETQRGQTRGTLSTGETVVGLVGVQTRLYEQQIISYKRDAESKGIKMMLDTWTARKTIDEGVAVPSVIDTPAINTAMAPYLANLELT